MKYYSQLLHIEANNKLAEFCNKKLHELNKLDDNTPFWCVKKWRKYFYEFDYYNAICKRVLEENKFLLDELKKG